MGCGCFCWGFWDLQVLLRGLDTWYSDGGCGEGRGGVGRRGRKLFEKHGLWSFLLGVDGWHVG